jgi:hypothetical protein
MTGAAEMSPYLQSLDYSVVAKAEISVAGTVR